MHLLPRFEVRDQQIEHMLRSAQKGNLRALGFQCPARVANVFIAQPIGQHHHHAGRGGLDFARIDGNCARPAHAVEHGLDGMGLVLQHPLEMGLQPPVLGQQVVEVTVQKAVLPDQFEQRVHEEPGMLDIAQLVAGVEQFVQRTLITVEQRIDQFVLGRVVVVQVARADVEFGGDEGGGDIGLAEPVEKVERDLQDALGGSAGRFPGHAQRAGRRPGANAWASSSRPW